MAQITSGIGLVSGINYSQIINELISIEEQPVNQLQARIAGITNTQAAYTAIEGQLTGIQSVGQTLQKPSTFQNATTNSSNSSVLTATASPGAAVGTYQFQVAQLVSTQQSISRGYTDPNQAKVGAGTLTLQMGGGEITAQNNLADLRGGAGISHGQFRITDRSGNSAIIDTTSDITLNDVVQQINTSLGISVKASIQGDHLVLQDETGKSTNDLTVTDLGEGQAAADLGIAGNSAGTNTLAGSDINFLSASTSLSAVNDGRGISTADGGNDFEIATADGSTVDVSVATAKTIGDVISAINTAGAGKVQASIAPGANGITLTDLTTGGAELGVTALNGSQAAAGLGILTTGAAGVINGSQILAGLGTVLVSSLNGGAGLNLGTISIQSRSASAATPPVAAVNINLAGATSVADIINDINNANAGVTAAVNNAGDGIEITDTSGGTGNLVIGDATGTSAADLGISGTFDTTTTSVQGKNLNRQWVSDNTQLSDYNGGQGVTPGVFTITNSAGAATTLDLSSGTATDIGDIINDINIRDIGVTASINANGNGILLTDTAGGTGKLTVADTSGTMAHDLNIAGTATGTTIDGAEEKTIAVDANDTLTTLQNKINALGWGVTATIINDGSTSSPYRLSLNANNSGLAGRVVIDDGTTGLGTQTLVAAQNAAVFVGGSGSSQPLLITSNKNQLTGVIQGVNVNLVGVSDAPVTLSVTSDISNVESQINTFVTTFNSMITSINNQSSFDTTTNTAGLLLGDSTTQQVEQEVYAMMQATNPNSGQFKSLADVGITIGDGAQLVFDQNKFEQAWAEDPSSVTQLFTQSTTSTVDGKSTTVTPGLGFTITNTITDLTDPVTGLITVENNTLSQRTQQFQDQITQLNTLIEQKRERLQEQFANLETVLAGLQSQQAAIGQITTIKPITTSSSSSSSKAA